MSPARHFLVTIAAARLVAAQLPGQAALPACGQTCLNNMLGSLSCPASDLGCLCPKPDFGFGIRDCASAACGAGVAATFTNWATSVCATVTPEAAAVPTTTTTKPSTPAPVSAAVTSTTLISTSTALTTPTTSLPPAPILTSTTTVPSTITTTSITTSISTPTTTATTASSAHFSRPASSSTSTTSAPVSTDTPASDATPQMGLTLAAKIGIGVGAGAGAAALLGLLLCILARRKRTSKLPRGGNASNLKISHPMPGGGRVDASPSGQNMAFGASKGAGVKAGAQRTDTGMSELEMNARRYEEMVPRHQPRTMV